MANTSHSIRTASYSIEEDQLLCGVYLDIAQDPDTGKDQGTQQFWSRIEIEYHQMLPAHLTNTRSSRSLQSRMQNILTVVSKFRGCIRQIENMNLSGASEQDVLDKAKNLLAQDPKYRKGFKFDHVWPILKDIEKFKATSREQSLGSGKRTTPIQASQSQPDRVDRSIGSSSFCVDLNDDFESEDKSNEIPNDSKRPSGRKKEKLKKQLHGEGQEFLTSMKEENDEIKGMFQQSLDVLQKNNEVQLLKAQTAAKKIDLEERREENKMRREENKILCIDLDSIKDPIVRDSIKNDQLRIVAKRANYQPYGGGIETSQFNQYFGNLGGNNGGLGEY